MIPTAVLTKLATLGLNAEQAEAVAGMLSTVEAATKGEADAVIEKSREKVRARVQKWRAKQDVTLPNVTERYVTAHASASPAPDLEKKQTNKQGRKQDAPAARSDLDAFKSELAPHLGEERLEAIIKHRRAKRAQLTGLSARLFIADAEACGMFVEDAVDTCISRNWITVKADWLQSRNSQGPPAAKGVVGAAQRMMEKSNGSESIFGSSGNGKLISAEPNDEPGRSAENLQGGLGRRYLSSNH